MSVKIMIERKFKEAPVPGDFRVINKLRRDAMRQKGYVSGETLVNFENYNVVVLSVWSSLDDWNAWLNSQERDRLESELTPHLEEPVKIRTFISSLRIRPQHQRSNTLISFLCPLMKGVKALDCLSVIACLGTWGDFFCLP